MFIVRLCVIHHLFLHTGRNIVGVTLATFDRASCSETHKTSDRGVWWYDSPIFDNATVFQNASSSLLTDESLNSLKRTQDLERTYDDNVFADKNIRSNRCSLNHWIFTNEYMITNIQREECNTTKLKKKKNEKFWFECWTCLHTQNWIVSMVDESPPSFQWHSIVRFSH